jgi:hypothetical protein
VVTSGLSFPKASSLVMGFLEVFFFQGSGGKVVVAFYNYGLITFRNNDVI